MIRVQIGGANAFDLEGCVATEMVRSFRKFAFYSTSHRPKQHYVLVDTVRGKRISPDAALHGVPPLKTFVQIEHVSEPKEIDKPVQCPPSENSIIQDGLTWREIIASFRRQMKKTGTCQEGDAVGCTESITENPRRSDSGNLAEKNLLVTSSALARLITEALE